MNSNSILFVFVRHSERLDQVSPSTYSEAEKNLTFPTYDSPITTPGKQVAADVGKMTREWISSYHNGAFSQCQPINLCSPFIRTL